MFEKYNEIPSGAHWERQTIQKVLLEHLKEQRRARRWGIFFKLIIIAFVIGLLFWVMGGGNKDLPPPVLTKAHTAVIDVRGEILPEQDASADNIRVALKSAFDNKNVKGVVLRINSPGGSPVQARQIYDDIMLLKAKHPAVKVYAAIEELGTSAAYLIAAATDFIYADETSLIGSIGVRMDSFGFVDTMQKLGVERRAYTAGVYKNFLDPFLPRNPANDQIINAQLKLVHQAFIQNVRDGRGARLKETPDIFSGLFWTGEQALALGLIDGFGDAQYVAREIVKTENIVDYTPSAGLLDRLANRIGATMSQTFLKVRNHYQIY